MFCSDGTGSFCFGGINRRDAVSLSILLSEHVTLNSEIKVQIYVVSYSDWLIQRFFLRVFTLTISSENKFLFGLRVRRREEVWYTLPNFESLWQ